MRRGLSEAVALSIVTAIMFVVLIAIVFSMPKPPTQPTTKIISVYLNMFSIPNIYLVPTSSGALLMNRGSVSIHIKYLIVEYNNSVDVLRQSGSSFGALCNASSTFLSPGSSIVISCIDKVRIVAVVGANGRIIAINPRLYARIPAPQAINQIPILNISASQALSEYLLPSTNVLSPIVEIVNTTRILGPSYIPLNLVLRLNTSGSISMDLYASWVFIAYTPGSNDSEFNILITGIADSKHRLTIETNAGELSIGSGVTRFRIKILGFSKKYGIIEIGNNSSIRSPGIYPCGYINGGFCRVEILGTAKVIEVYTNSSKGGLVSSLNPYILTGDLLGDGHTGILLTTEDFSYGNQTVVDDEYVDPVHVLKKHPLPGHHHNRGRSPRRGHGRGHRGGSSRVANRTIEVHYTLIERLLKPVTIVFRNLPINNSKIATAIVSVRFIFWDDANNGTVDNDNMPIIKIGLYDPKEKRLIYSVSFSYFDLCRLRSVYPPTWAFAVRNALLYIPSPSLVGGSRVYYIALQIDDPFGVSYQSGEIRNDADLFVYIDYVGVVLSQR